GRRNHAAAAFRGRDEIIRETWLGGYPVSPGLSMRPDFLFDGPEGADIIVVLAHGAGAPMDSPFMKIMARGLSGDLAATGVRVARFEFPYMAARRSGARRPPDREPVLRQVWHAAVEALGGGSRVVIGGKSMGGRIA